MKEKMLAFLLAAAMLAVLAGCGGGNAGEGAPTADGQKAGADRKDDKGEGAPTTLIYGSGDYTRINPALDEHGEINLLIFDGLTAHDGDNEVVPALAERWDYDADTYTYTFYLRDGVSWHDGEPFTADDVQFTIEAVMDPENASENAADFEDVEEITVVDKQTISFRLSMPNAAFTHYMSMPVLPRHLLEGEDMQTSDFFRSPVGTGPYRLASWDTGAAITLERNEDYFKGAAKLERIIFKIVPDDNARALQMRTGELDLAQLAPRDAANFTDDEAYRVYEMTTSDYRGIMFNFANAYWQKNRDLIPAVCYGIDREAIVETVLLGQGMSAYGPLQRNPYDYADVEHYDYSPENARNVLEQAGCVQESDGFYYRGGEKVGFTISVGAGDQVRLDMAQVAAQQLREIGMDVRVDVPAQIDWGAQEAYLIGWGSPFDADDHAYKVFGTNKGANYSSYSNEAVDTYLRQARESDDESVRKEAYASFQRALADDPPFAFICYIDADYVAKAELSGIDGHTVMGHHGVGIFWNVTEWEFSQ